MALDSLIKKLCISLSIASLSLNSISVAKDLKLPKTKELSVIYQFLDFKNNSYIDYFNQTISSGSNLLMNPIGPEMLACDINYTSDIFSVTVSSSDINSRYLFRIDDGNWHNEPFSQDIDPALIKHSIDVIAIGESGFVGKFKTFYFDDHFK